MEATFRLRRQTSRWARFAEVTVEVEPADESEVVLSPDAFAWRKSVYGPEAWSSGEYDQLLLAQAREGAVYALQHVPEPLANARVRVVAIHEAPADTTPDAVKLATAGAVLRALGHVPDSPPFLGPDGAAVFPG